MAKVVITNGKRTPIGSLSGSLSSFSAAQLGSFAIKAVIEESKIDMDLIDEVIFGNVLTAGQGQAPRVETFASSLLILSTSGSICCLT